MPISERRHQSELHILSRACLNAAMSLTRRTALAGLGLASAGFAARAQAWPAKPLTIVVPYTAGSATDTLTRILAERLSPRPGQPVIVDNKAGASGSIAGGFVARAPADGYTLMMATAATHAGNPNLMKAVPYDSLADFAPTGFCGSIPFTLAVRADSGIASLADFVARAKAAKPPLTSGAGTPSARVISTTLAQRSGTELVHVPYKAAPLAMADVLSGQIDMTFIDVGTGLPQFKAGKLKALVVASGKRSPLIPDVPTFAEAGLGAFALDAWFVVVAPARTPTDVVSKIGDHVSEIVAEPETAARLRAISIEPEPMAPDQIRAFMKAEKEKWAMLVKAAGIDPE